MTGVFGGMFDPPHLGHVALLEAAKRSIAFEDVLVLVVADPGHRTVETPAGVRRALARAAFPDETVELEGEPRMIDTLRARRLSDPVLIVGSDELVDFPRWKDPQAILELARLAVGARPGSEVVEPPHGTIVFELEPSPVSSTEIRRRVGAGEPIDGLVPAAVAAEIERLGLYRH